MAGIGAIANTLFPQPGHFPALRETTPGTKLATTSGGGRGSRAVAENRDVGASAATEKLTDAQKKEVTELKRRDQEVRQHEQAHVAAAGRYAKGGPQYEFTTGPDGRQYATGGHVNIDVSPAATPEATIQKAQVIRRAASAPAEPSGQDRAVAAQASQLESEARRELQEAQQEEARGAGDESEQSTVGGPAGTASPLDPPPALRREISQYQPEEAGQRVTGGGISGVGRLDLSV